MGGGSGRGSRPEIVFFETTEPGNRIVSGSGCREPSLFVTEPLSGSLIPLIDTDSSSSLRHRLPSCRLPYPLDPDWLDRAAPLDPSGPVVGSV